MTENKYKSAEIRERNRLLMDEEAHKHGYKSWAEYYKMAAKIEHECELAGRCFSFDMVPDKSMASYTPLHSRGFNAIFSAGGFANADLIANFKRNVLSLLQKAGSNASWIFETSVSSEENSGGELLNWESVLTVQGKPHSVVFVQNGFRGDLVVIADRCRISVGRFSSFDAKFLREFWSALGVVL